MSNKKNIGNLTPYAAAVLMFGIFMYLLSQFLENSLLLSVTLSLLAGISSGLSIKLSPLKTGVPKKNIFYTFLITLIPFAAIFICLYSLDNSCSSRVIITAGLAATALLMAGKAEARLISHLNESGLD
jgi:hypothetical protein